METPHAQITLEIVIQKDLAAVSRSGAARFVSLASDAISRKSRFSVALSGGSTPRELYHLLASDEFRSQVRWDRVYFFFGDERCVPPDSPESNYRMALESMLGPLRIPDANVFRWRGEDDPQLAAAEYESRLKLFFEAKLPSFDLVLLGMGSDGHTASLFPQSLAVHENIRIAVANRVEKLEAYRLTLTFPAINNSANVVFLVAGSDKAAVLCEVLEGDKPVDELPSKGIKPVTGSLAWLIDDAAASLLDRTAIGKWADVNIQ